jgi:Nitrile hydratase, alpha chain
MDALQDKAAPDLGKVIFTAWHDPDFRAKLTADPHAALAGAGITIPAGMTIKYVEDNPTHVHLVIDLAVGSKSICLGSVWIRLVLDNK